MQVGIVTINDFSRAKRRAGLATAAAAAALVSMVAGLGVARAEAPRFTAELDRNQVSVGEPFVYEVTLSVGNDEISDYRPPDFKGLRVLSTPRAPNQSTQMQFGGAGMFVQISYSWRYELAAIQKGAIAIGPARVRVNGQEFRSTVVTLSVSAGGAQAPPSNAGVPAPSGRSATAAEPVQGGPPSTGAFGAAPPEAAEGRSFIRLVTDRQKAFVGEAISAAWYLYMNQPADNYNTQVEPHTEGFWTEDVQVPSRRGGLMLTQEEVQGRIYQVGVVLKKALFPLHAGELTITPMEADISRSDFFGTAIRSQRVRSLPTVVEVLPLPKVGQPTGFDPANVGNFTFNARVDRAEVAVGEAVTLTIEASGRGSIRKLVLPTVPKLPGWKAYEPRVNVVIDPATGVTGSKTAEVLLLPEHGGAVTLPALSLDFFDPEARGYRRSQTAPIVLNATGGGIAAADAGGGRAPAIGGGVFGENIIAGEIRPLHARAALRRDLGTTFFRTGAFTAMLALPPLGFALALIGFRIRDRLSEDTGSRRRRRAQKKVRAHLAAAHAHMRRGERGAFFIEIDRVVREALSSRLGLPVKGLRMDELGALLRGRGLPATEADRVIALIEDCDHARFAPSAGGPDGDAATMAPTLEAANTLIDIIERARLSEEAAG